MHVLAELWAVTVTVSVVLGDKQQRVDHLVEEGLGRQRDEELRQGKGLGKAQFSQ